MRFGIGLKGNSFGLLFLLIALAPCSADELRSCPVTLAWDASPDFNVTGYALYYGLENSTVTNRVDVGPVQSVTLTNLQAFSNYFFYAVSYNVVGMESVPSGALFYRPPALTKLRISKHPNGSTVLRFRSGAGSLCRVEYASTPQITGWQTLATIRADAGGNVVIRDSSVGPQTTRFYRAVRIETYSGPGPGTQAE
jgi:hypothetical protein